MKRLRPLCLAAPALGLAALLGGCTYPAIVYAPAPSLTPLIETAGDVRLAGRWSPVGVMEEDRIRTAAGDHERLTERPWGSWDAEVVASPAPHVSLFALASHADTYEHRHTAYDVGVGTYWSARGGEVLGEVFLGWGSGTSVGLGRDNGDIREVLTFEDRPFRVDGEYARAFGQANLGLRSRWGFVFGTSVRLSRVDFEGTYTGTRDPAAVLTDAAIPFLEHAAFVRVDAGLPVSAEVALGQAVRMDGRENTDIAARAATLTVGLGVRLDALWRGLWGRRQASSATGAGS